MNALLLCIQKPAGRPVWPGLIYGRFFVDFTKEYRYGEDSLSCLPNV